MIHALVEGTLSRKAISRTDKNGRVYVTALLRTVDRNSTVFVGLIAWDRPVVDTLLALAEGALLAVTGTLQADLYTSKDGTPKPDLHVVVGGILPLEISRAGNHDERIAAWRAQPKDRGGA